MKIQFVNFPCGKKRSFKEATVTVLCDNDEFLVHNDIINCCTLFASAEGRTRFNVTGVTIPKHLDHLLCILYGTPYVYQDGAVFEDVDWKDAMAEVIAFCALGAPDWAYQEIDARFSRILSSGHVVSSRNCISHLADLDRYKKWFPVSHKQCMLTVVSLYTTDYRTHYTLDNEPGVYETVLFHQYKELTCLRKETIIDVFTAFIMNDKEELGEDVNPSFYRGEHYFSYKGSDGTKKVGPITITIHTDPVTLTAEGAKVYFKGSIAKDGVAPPAVFEEWTSIELNVEGCEFVFNGKILVCGFCG